MTVWIKTVIPNKTFSNEEKIYTKYTTFIMIIESIWKMDANYAIIFQILQHILQYLLVFYKMTLATGFLLTNIVYKQTCLYEYHMVNCWKEEKKIQ